MDGEIIKKWQSRKATTQCRRIEMPNKIFTFSQQKTENNNNRRIGWMDGPRWSCFCLVHACACVSPCLCALVCVASIRNPKIYYVFRFVLSNNNNNESRTKVYLQINTAQRGLGRSRKRRGKNKTRWRRMYAQINIRNSIWLWNSFAFDVRHSTSIGYSSARMKRNRDAKVFV